jgi:hypothetical protein
MGARERRGSQGMQLACGSTSDLRIASRDSGCLRPSKVGNRLSLHLDTSGKRRLLRLDSRCGLAPLPDMRGEQLRVDPARVDDRDNPLLPKQPATWTVYKVRQSRRGLGGRSQDA